MHLEERRKEGKRKEKEKEDGMEDIKGGGGRKREGGKR